MADKLTTQAYWEKYYKGSKIELEHIVKVCSVYDSFWDTLLQPEAKGKTLIEIGGYPGRYLAYLAYRYNIEPTCLDFNSDTKVVENTFNNLGIEDYQVIQGDFTTYEVNKQYDYVISNGFIEHFEDYDSIMDRHIEFLKPGGKLFIMIPNKRYLRRLYGYLCDYDNLKAHNLKCMSKKVFKTFAVRNNLKVERLEYFGGFPFNVHQKLNIFQKVIFKLTRLIFKFYINPNLVRKPSKYLSANLIGIFEKPNGKEV